MTEVSHFELLLKPQAPSGPGSGGPSTVATVLQGYFLELTNLEDTAYQFRVDLVIEPPAPSIPNRQQRTLAGNALAFVDTATQNNQSSAFGGNINDSVFPLPNGTVQIEPGGTALIAVLPNAFSQSSPLTPGGSSGPPLFEVRGYVRLRLPSVRFVKQTDSPVKVLATPQNRATYLSTDGTSGSSGMPTLSISDQTQASLPLASGQAKLEVEPEDFIFRPPRRDFEDLLDCADRFSQTLSAEAQAELLIGQMMQLDPDSEAVSQINKALKDAGANIAIKKGK